MATAAQVRDKLAALTTKRAAVEQVISTCEPKKAVKMNGLADHDLPILSTVEGVDPSTIRLVAPIDE